jgi:hypothetical protein
MVSFFNVFLGESLLSKMLRRLHAHARPPDQQAR